MPACKKESVATNTDLPVVSGYLIPGQLITVKLYQQKSITDTAVYGPPITGLKVYLSDGSSNVQLTESAKGTYTYNVQSFLVAGKTYTLQFNYLTHAVSAKTVMPDKPTNFVTQYSGVSISTTTTSTTVLDNLSWDNPNSLNHVLVFDNLDGSSFPLSAIGANRPANFEINTNNASYYTLTESSFPYYGHYKVILLRVNQEYIDLINSNTSSSTSQNLTQTPTNIINGFGVFTAMQSDTLTFNVL
ncbi:MAG: hypothetical protein JWQ84_2462 [Mucilaginibacter sp.]|nr:hypothetical protein [Mucilaginibacter sp.]MDB5017630.1 hypothetical protein [Mucilaginibacter sp.]MDB5139699.1 hypothetical protein [Mucilaginibacter sp.]